MGFTHGNGSAGVAAMIELAGEPLFVLAQLQMRMRLRVLVETAANAAKGVATLLLLSLPARLQPDPALSLSFAQVSFHACLPANIPALLLRAAFLYSRPPPLDSPHRMCPVLPPCLGLRSCEFHAS